MKVIRRWSPAARIGAAVALLASVVVVMLVPATAQASSGPKHGGTLTFGLEAESAGYVPGISTEVAYSGGAVEAALYDTLTTFSNSGKAVPFLATSVTSDPTYTTWTVKLRSGVRFDDGSTLTAQDVVDDLTEYYNAPTSALSATYSEVKTATASGPLTVVFTLNAPDSQFPALLTEFYVFNPDLKSLYGSDFGAHPDGTGPYELQSWIPNDEVVLKANPYYWEKGPGGAKLPYVSTLVLKIIVSGATRNDALESGELDGFQSIETPILAQAAKIPNVKVLTSETGGYGWFFNTTKAPLNDVRVRQALAYATNNKAIVASQGAGNIIHAMDEYFPSTSAYYSAAAEKITPSYNLKKAKALIKSYEDDPHRSDGQPVGSPVSIQLDYLSGDPASGAAVQVAQQEWGAIGVKVTLNSLAEATLITAALQGNDQAFWFGWGAETPYELFHHNYLPPSQDPTNWTRFQNATLSEQINVLATCVTNACTTAATDKIATVFAQQVPVVFLMDTLEGWPINTSKVGGAQLWTGSNDGLNPDIEWQYLYVK